MALLYQAVCGSKHPCQYFWKEEHQQALYQHHHRQKTEYPFGEQTKTIIVFFTYQDATDVGDGRIRS